MAALSLDVVLRNLNRLGGIGLILSRIGRSLEVVAVGGVREHFQTHTDPDGRPWPRIAARPDGSANPLQDTGRLQASVKAKLSARELILTASHPGANLHQYGGEVRAKPGKFLAIPQTREAKRAGSPRNFRREMHLMISGDKQTGYLVQDVSRGRSVLQYVLKRSVRIKKRTYLGFSRSTLDKIERLVFDAVAEFLLRPWSPNPWAGFNVRRLGS